MAMEHVPREQAGTEGAAQSDERRHRDPHWVRTGQKQAGQSAHEKPDEEQDDEIGKKSHGCIVPSRAAG